MAVLQALADGETYRQVGDELEIPDLYVRQIMWKIIRKLHVSNGTNAAAVAIRRGLID